MAVKSIPAMLNASFSQHLSALILRLNWIHGLSPHNNHQPSLCSPSSRCVTAGEPHGLKPRLTSPRDDFPPRFTRGTLKREKSRQLQSQQLYSQVHQVVGVVARGEVVEEGPAGVGLVQVRVGEDVGGGVTSL